MSTIAKESLSHYESAHAAKYESVTFQIMKPFTMTKLRYDTISHPTKNKCMCMCFLNYAERLVIGKSSVQQNKN